MSTTEQATTTQSPEEIRRAESHANDLKNSRAGRVFGYALSLSLVATGVAALATAYVAVTKE